MGGGIGYHSNNECMYIARFPCRPCKIPAANLVRLVCFLHARLCTVHILHSSKTCKIIARSCKIVATSLAICKIFEQVYKILLQEVSDSDASQPASFLQEPYVWDSSSVEQNRSRRFKKRAFENTKIHSALGRV